MRNYQVECTLYNNDLTVIETQKKAIKTITPGDAPFQVPITWNSEEALRMINVSFVDPQGYKVLEQVVHLKVLRKTVNSTIKDLLLIILNYYCFGRVEK